MNSFHQSDKVNPHPLSKSAFYKQNDLQMLQTQHSSCSSNGRDEFFEDNEIGFEEDCLIKLRDQRKKIQEITYLYQRTEDQLKKEEEKVKKMEFQMTNYQDLKNIKLKYLSLTKQFEESLMEKQQLQVRSSKLQQSLEVLSKEHQQLIKLSQLQKLRKQQELNQEINHYQELLKDKDDEVRRNLNVYEMKQRQYEQSIHNLNELIIQLRNDINEMKRNSQAQISTLTSQLIKKDGFIQRMKKAMDNVKEENSTLRNQLKQTESQFLSKEQQWLQGQDQLIFELNNMKRKLADSQTRYNQSRYECQKLDQKHMNAIQSISGLKQALKKLQQQSLISMDKLTHSYEQKISQYKNQAQQLKESIHELLQVKNMYNKENDMLKQKINQNNDQKRKRNLMMRQQLRQIQKIQNSVKKVI